MGTEPSAISSFDKYIFDTSSRKLRKSRYQSLLVLSGFAYFVFICFLNFVRRKFEIQKSISTFLNEARDIELNVQVHGWRGLINLKKQVLDLLDFLMI